MTLGSDKEYWDDVTKALYKAVRVFYRSLEDRGWDANIAIKIGLYQISSDYECVLEELHYSNLGMYLPDYNRLKRSGGEENNGECEIKG